MNPTFKQVTKTRYVQLVSELAQEIFVQHYTKLTPKVAAALADKYQSDILTDDEIHSASFRLDTTIGPRRNHRAYGNDDSVFITVDTDRVSGSTSYPITDINGVYTGVQDVATKIPPNTASHYRLDVPTKYLNHAGPKRPFR